MPDERLDADVICPAGANCTRFGVWIAADWGRFAGVATRAGDAACDPLASLLMFIVVSGECLTIFFLKSLSCSRSAIEVEFGA